MIDETSDVPLTHPRPEQLANALAHIGLGSDHSAQTRIIIYDDSKIRSSARAWFLLHTHGIKNIAILDGGLAKWQRENRPIETKAQSGKMARAKANVPLVLSKPERFRYKQDMLANIDTATEHVVDARDTARFNGDAEGSGHIPGSCNLPYPTLFNDDGTYKSPNDIDACFAQIGITPDKPVTATCGSGMTACVLLFALHLIGRDNGALYDGSWTEWGSDPDTPKDKQ